MAKTIKKHYCFEKKNKKYLFGNEKAALRCLYRKNDLSFVINGALLFGYHSRGE